MTSEGGETARMPYNMQRERCRRFFGSALFVAPMKSLTDTSIISTGFSGMVGCREFGIITASSLCQGSVVFPFAGSEMMSLAVSDPAHKHGVDPHRPLYKSVGTTSSVLPRDNFGPSATRGT